MKAASVFFGLGAVSAAVAVALGALGAHALRGRLDASALSSFQTAVQYQFLHSLAVCIVALWLHGMAQDASARNGGIAAAWAFCVGIVLFSGSIYGLVLGAPRWLGPVTPVGGVAFIVGWLVLAATAFRRATSL
jgi:uncharacterized membrane protein YgdD (TMEM256/DUF423 family)